MSTDFDPYYKWLAIPPKDQPANHYRLLGLDLFESDPDVIAGAADQRMSHVRSFQTGKHSALSQKLLNEIAAARVCLLNPEKKADYDEGLRQQTEPVVASLQPPPPVQYANISPPPLGPTLLQSSTDSQLPWSEPGHLPTTASAKRRGKRSRQLLVAIIGLAVLCVGTVVMLLPGSDPGQVVQVDPDITATGKPDDRKPPTPNKQPKIDTPARPPDKLLPEVPPRKRPKPEPEPDKTPTDEPPREKPEPPTADKPTASLRLPVPDTASVAKSLKDIREEYRAEYAKLEDGSMAISLAKELLRKARELTNGPVARFAFFGAATDMAARSGNVEVAFETIDEMARAYEIDALEMLATKLEALEKAEASERVVGLEELLGNQVGIETRAEILADATLSMGKEVAVQARAGLLETMATADHRVAESARRNAIENLENGKTLCFAQGNWEEGLPQLALGSDAALRKLAITELKGEQTPAEQVLLGDGWWNLAEREEGAVKKELRVRAARWYRQAVTKLTGSEKERVTARVKTLAGIDEKEPPESKLAKFLVGEFQVVAVEKQSKRRKTSVYEFRPDNTLLEDGVPVGTWKADRLRASISYSDPSQGVAVIDYKRKSLDGKQIKDGELWQWSMLKLVVVAEWEHRAGGDQPSTLKFWSTGRLVEPDGESTWTLQGSQLTLRWSTGWVDRCIVSPDGRAYQGKNQNGTPIRGRLISRGE